MRKIRMVIGCIIGLSIVLTGLSDKLSAQEKPKEELDPKAKEMVLEAFKKTYQTKGFHFESKSAMSVSMMGFYAKRESSTEGVHRSSDITYLKVKTRIKSPIETIEKEFECYQKGAKFIVRFLSDKEWLEPWAREKEIILKIEKLALLKEFLKEASFAGEEKINNKECHIIKISLTPEGLPKYLTAFKRVLEGQEGEIEYTDFVSKVWVGKDDGLVYKLVFSVTVIGEKEVGMPTRPRVKWKGEVKFGSYNKDIDLEIPSEVKELLEKKEEGEEKEE